MTVAASAAWIDTDEGFDRVAERLVREADAGRPTAVDVEFDGGGAEFSIRKQSPVARSRLVVWSVACYTGAVHPRGYKVAAAVGLPERAADHPSLRRWLESDAPKAAHNAPAEAHTFGNRGIRVGGLINTLSLARFLLPGRLEYGLDALGIDYLGVGKAAWNWNRPRVVTVPRSTKERKCECGAVPCRRQQKTPGHTRIETVREWSEDVVRGVEPKPLREILPGHADWDAWLGYFTRDAWMALSLLSALERQDRQLPNPWAVDRLAELTRLTEEVGGYDAERQPQAPLKPLPLDLWGEAAA